MLGETIIHKKCSRLYCKSSFLHYHVDYYKANKSLGYDEAVHQTRGRFKNFANIQLVLSTDFKNTLNEHY